VKPAPEEKKMTDSELDAVYTRLCQAMTELGEPLAPLFLARFALLACTRIGDAEVVMRMIEAASEGLVPMRSARAGDLSER
jgi:hypothetical protein